MKIQTAFNEAPPTILLQIYVNTAKLVSVKSGEKKHAYTDLSQVNFRAHNPKTLKLPTFMSIRIPFETTV